MYGPEKKFRSIVVFNKWAYVSVVSSLEMN